MNKKQNEKPEIITKEEKQTRGLLPLTSDIVFKRVFSREGNEKILKSLLEAILDTEIQKVEVRWTKKKWKIYNSKKSNSNKYIDV